MKKALFTLLAVAMLMPISLVAQKVSDLARVTTLSSNALLSVSIPNGAGWLTRGVSLDSLHRMIGGTLTPLQFGAVGDGVTDDTLSWSNTIVAVNNTNNPPRINLLGKTIRWESSPPPITRGGVEIYNGTLQTHSTNDIYAIGHVNATAAGTDPHGLRLHHLTIQRIGPNMTNAPSANNFGVWLGTDWPTSGNYWEGVEIENCKIYNFNKLIVIGGASQTRIINNTLLNAWSNQIYFQPNTFAPDMVEIGFNQMNQADSRFYVATMQQRTNMIGIQVDSNNKGLHIHNNNGGGGKQWIKIGPSASTGLVGVRLHMNDNQVESLWTANTNIVAVEIWNSVVRSYKDSIAIGSVGFGSSNYLAQIGLYATNGANLNFHQCFFDQAPGGRSFDVWSSAGYGLENDGMSYPPFIGPGTVRVHAAQFDAGTVISFPNYYSGTDKTQWINGTNQIISILNSLILGDNWITLNRVGPVFNISPATVFSGSATFGGATFFNGQPTFNNSFLGTLTGNGGGLTNLNIKRPNIGTAYFSEEFASGNAGSSGDVGKLGWLYRGVLTSNFTQDQNHPGTLLISNVTATAGQLGGVYLTGGPNGNGPFAIGVANWSSRFVFRCGHTNLVWHRIGFLQSLFSATADARAGAFLTLDTAIGQNFRFTTHDGTSATHVDTGVQSDLNWHTLEIWSEVNNQYKFMLDGGAVTTITTTPPAIRCGPVFSASTLDATHKSVEADFWDFSVTVTR